MMSRSTIKSRSSKNIKKSYTTNITYLELRCPWLELSENKCIIEAMVLVSLNKSGVII